MLQSVIILNFAAALICAANAIFTKDKNFNTRFLKVTASLCCLVAGLTGLNTLRLQKIIHNRQEAIRKTEEAIRKTEEQMREARERLRQIKEARKQRSKHPVVGPAQTSRVQFTKVANQDLVLYKKLAAVKGRSIA